MKEGDGTRPIKEGILNAYETYFWEDCIAVSGVAKARIFCRRWKVYRVACKYFYEHLG